MSYKQALHAYQQAQQSAMSPRYMERAAFARAISKLKQAQNNVENYSAYADALKFNQRLWTHIQSNLADNGDRLPAGIRNNLAKLSIFIDRQTISALTEPKAENLEALINIDVNISRGLETSPAVDETKNLPPSPGSRLI